MRVVQVIWSLVLIVCIVAAVLGQALYASILGAHSWSEELQESGMSAAAAAYARAYVWELAELDTLDELGIFGKPLEWRLQQVIAGYLSEQWITEQLNRLQAGVWDVFEGKRDTLPPLDVSELKDKLTAEVTKVIPYSVLRSIGWELAMPERIDTMKLLKLERAELAEWRAAYEQAGAVVRALLVLCVGWLIIGLALNERPLAALGWIVGCMLAAELLLLALHTGVERRSGEWIRELFTNVLNGQQPNAEARAVYNSAAHVAELWLREASLLAAGWAWYMAAAGAVAVLFSWLSRRRRKHGTATERSGTHFRLSRGVRVIMLVSSVVFTGMTIAVIL